MRRGLEAAEAQQTILEAAQRLPAEVCLAAQAQDRILAEAIVSTRRLPPWAVSAMDGYALHGADLEPCSKGLLVTQEIAAGAAPAGALSPGEAARIFTGAPIPPDTAAVVRQEDTQWQSERLVVGVSVKAGENVREAGEDIDVGDEVLGTGTHLGPAALGVLASVGRTTVAVFQRPRVALLSSGDELIEPDGDPGIGRIVSSNSYSLAAQARDAGAEPIYTGIAADTPEALEAMVRAAMTSHVIVSSAGVSVGDRDYVRPVLEALDCELMFWGVKIKPGFPLVFGRFGESGPLVFGLPGNPVSAMVTFEQFVRPALLKMAGHQTLHRPRLRARLTERLTKSPGRLHLVRVTLERRGEDVFATSTGNQSSGVLRSMARAQGLLIFPAEADLLESGAEAEVQVLDTSFLAAASSGL